MLTITLVWLQVARLRTICCKLLLLGQTEADTLFLREALAPKSAGGLDDRG